MAAETSAVANERKARSLREVGIFLHRWLGLTVGLVFLSAGLTGAILAYAPQLTGALFPVIDGPPPEGWQQHRATVLQQIEESGQPVTLVRFPNQHQSAYELYLADDTLEYRDAVSGGRVLVREPLGDILAFSRELHTHLFLGHEGEELLGWLGVAMLVLVGTGLWLWWPRFGLWKFAFTRPRTRALAPQLFWWHKTVGSISLATLFFVTLTGVAMVFYSPAQKILTAAFGGESPAVPQKLEQPASSSNWNAIVATLDATLPEGRLVFFYPPQSSDDVLLFRKQMPEELHPNGRSFIALTPSGELLYANDATQLGAGMRATHAIYPLHSGMTGSETWRFVVFLMGLAPVFFFITGFWLWQLHRRRLQRNSRA